MLEMNKSEVQAAAWASLPQLKDAFEGNHSDLIAGYAYNE
jgi:hypothetical protein